jgi:hypothetical protein
VTDSWEPAFPGQRPPFGPGHVVSRTHGATSPRTIAPLAAEIEQEARGADWWPDWLTDPSYAAEVQAWSWSEAQARLLRAHVGELDLVDAMADTGTEESTETHTKAQSKRVTASRRLRSSLAELDRAEARAARLRSRLGLEPTSRARLMRDLSATRYMSGLVGSPLTAALDRLAVERAQRALEAGSDG